MMIYEVELNNGECVFSNKRDECIDKINYIIEKNKYNYVKKITLAVLDRLINVPNMTNPVIKLAKKTLIQTYYKDDIKYFIENDKKTRTDKALEKVISRLVIKLYSIQEARIHNDYDLYVKEQKRIQNENTEIKTTDDKNNKLHDTDNKIIDVNINDNNINANTDNKIIHTNNDEIDTFNNVKTINKIQAEQIDTADIEPNNNELVEPNNEIQAEQIDINNIEPNNNELVKSINEVDNNFNEIDTINNEIDTINNAVDDIDTTNNNIEPNNNDIDTINNVEPKQDNNNELVKTIDEIDNTDDTITEINDIDEVNNIDEVKNENHATSEADNNDIDIINANNDVETTTYYFNPNVNSEKFNRKKLDKRYYKKANNKQTLHVERDDMKRRNKTIKRLKLNKTNEKEISKINRIMRKYGTLNKLIKSIDDCKTLNELGFILQIYQELYEKECADTLNNAVYNQLLQREEMINGAENIIPNRTLLNQE